LLRCPCGEESCAALELELAVRFLLFSSAPLPPAIPGIGAERGLETGYFGWWLGSTALGAKKNQKNQSTTQGAGRNFLEEKRRTPLKRRTVQVTRTIMRIANTRETRT
jgi:hypothetical protein